MADSMNSPLLKAFNMMEMGKGSVLKKSVVSSVRRLYDQPLGTPAMEAMFKTIYVRGIFCRA